MQTSKRGVEVLDASQVVSEGQAVGSQVKSMLCKRVYDGSEKAEDHDLQGSGCEDGEDLGG